MVEPADVVVVVFSTEVVVVVVEGSVKTGPVVVVVVIAVVVVSAGWVVPEGNVVVVLGLGGLVVAGPRVDGRAVTGGEAGGNTRANVVEGTTVDELEVVEAGSAGGGRLVAMRSVAPPPKVSSPTRPTSESAARP